MTSVFVSCWKTNTEYLSDSTVLRKALDEYEQWIAKYEGYGKESYYWSLRSSQDATSPIIKAKETLIQQKAIALQNDTQFFLLSLAKIPEETQRVFLTAPNLSPYRNMLKQLFREGRYLLSEAEERILNLKTLPAHIKWVGMVSDLFATEEVEVQGQKEKKTFEETLALLQSKSKETREAAAEASYRAMDKHGDTATAELNAVLLNKKIDDEIRGMPRPDLARHIADDMESKTVDALVKAVSSRADISSRYYKLKARLLGEKTIVYHDKSAQHGDLPSLPLFEEAVGIVGNTLKTLDPECTSIFYGFLRNGQIDVFPYTGKSGGAFCASGLVSNPTYILLNYTGTMYDAEVLAHEVGHGIHNELMRKNRDALSFGTSLAVAEVASTFFEDFTLEEIGKNLKEEQRLALLMAKLNRDMSGVFRQIACYRFEWDLHHTFREKGHLSKEDIGELFVRNMSSYLGESVFFPPRAELGWTYWSHIRRFFYVYSYASGALIAKALQKKVRENPGEMENFKKILSLGTSLSPKDMFASVGIDISDTSFWLGGLSEIERLVQEAESLAEKMGR